MTVAATDIDGVFVVTKFVTVRPGCSACALAPGMNLTAEVKTGQRRTLDYLWSPVQRVVDESLKAR